MSTGTDTGGWQMVPAPVAGSAPGVRAVAAAVEETGRRLAAAATDLVRLRDGAVWDGPAGTAFGARIAQVPTALDRAARRHLCAAAPLRRFADVLEAEQAFAQHAARDHADAWSRHAVLEDRAAALVTAGRDETSPEVMVLRALQRDQLADAARAQARHRGALDRLEAEDRRCAGVLRALADDALADPLLYRGLRATSSFGHGVGALAGLVAPAAPPARLVSVVGDGTGVAADGALLLGYDEGGWGGLATGAGLAVMGVAGQSLRAGATAGAVVRADGAVVAGASLGAQERLVAGLAQTARGRVADARRLLEAPPERGTASALLGGPPLRGPRASLSALAVRGRQAAGARVGRVRLELASAAVGGRSTQRMYAAGVSLQAGAVAGDRLRGRRAEPSTVADGVRAAATER